MFDFITRLLHDWSYAGIFVLMVLENVFPPIPSELIMPLAGVAAAQGEMTLWGVIVAGTAGTVVGALPWYGLGRALGTDRLKRWAERHGRWLTLAPKDVDRANETFRRHCGKSVLIGRLIPAVRTLISVPAGVFRMGFPKFLAYTTLGGSLWTAALAFAGHSLGGDAERVSEWLNPVTNVVVGLLVLTYLYRLATWRRREQRS